MLTQLFTWARDLKLGLSSSASILCVCEQLSSGETAQLLWVPKSCNPSLVLVQPRKTHPDVTERL